MGPEDRLQTVIALRYFIPDGIRIAVLVSNHAEVSGRWAAPPAWST
jgi:alpha-glucosidase (family GH31 glycosyl hydrolase)